MNVKFNANETLKGLIAMEASYILHETLYHDRSYMLSPSECYRIVCKHYAVPKILENLLYLGLDWGNDVYDIFKSIFNESEDSKVLTKDFKYTNVDDLKQDIAKDVIDIINNDVKIQGILKEVNYKIPCYLGEETDKDKIEESKSYWGSPAKDGTYESCAIVYMSDSSQTLLMPTTKAFEYEGFVVCDNGDVYKKQRLD